METTRIFDEPFMEVSPQLLPKNFSSAAMLSESVELHRNLPLNRRIKEDILIVFFVRCCHILKMILRESEKAYD